MDTNSENVVEVKDKVIERVKVFDKKKLSSGNYILFKDKKD